MQKQRNIGIIGAGRAGSALAHALDEARYPVIAVASKSQPSATRLAKRLHGAQATPVAALVALCDTIFVAVPDDAIAEVANQCHWRDGQYVIHLSGAASLDTLAPAREAGASVGSFHPLQTFAGEGKPGRPPVAPTKSCFVDITVGIETEDELLTYLQKVAQDLGAKPLVVSPGAKGLYHAGAMLACNYVVTLVAAAQQLWATLGISEQESRAALLPLLRATVDNIESLGATDALTGPVARGDAGTIERHLVELGERAPAALEAYRELGRLTVPLALAKGTIDQQTAERLFALFKAVGARPVHPSTGSGRMGIRGREERDSRQEVRA